MPKSTGVVGIADAPLSSAEEPPEVVASSSARLLTAFALAVGIVGLVRVGVLPLFPAFRFDENLTAWVVDAGLGDAAIRSWRHQGQSPVYFVFLWFWAQIAGTSELALRIPSLVAAVVSAVLLHRIGRDWFNRDVGLFAGAALTGLNLWAAEARPYSFLILALILAVRSARRWSLQPSFREGARWMFFAAFTIAMHPFAIHSLVPQALFLYSGWRRGATIVDIAKLGVLFSALVVGHMPQVRALQARQTTLVIAEQPGANAVIFVLAFPLLVAVLVAVVAGRPSLRDHPAQLNLFAGAWATVPGLGLIVQSLATGDSVFVPRYMAGAAPGGALFLALCIAKIPAERRTLVGVATLSIFAGLVVSSSRFHASPGWEQTAVFLSRYPDAPAYTMTGYVESRDPASFLVENAPEYLNAPLTIHDPPNRLIGVPWEAKPEDVVILDQFLREAMRSEEILVVETDYRPIVPAPGVDYFIERLVASGYTGVEDHVAPGILTRRFTR